MVHRTMPSATAARSSSRGGCGRCAGPAAIASSALPIRLTSTCSSRLGSQATASVRSTSRTISGRTACTRVSSRNSALSTASASSALPLPLRPGLRANDFSAPVMRPIFSTRPMMVPRLSWAVARSPRARNFCVLPDSVRSAASGWFSSCAMPVDICPTAASLPACSRPSCAWRNSRSVRIRSAISVCSRWLALVRSAVRSATLRSSSLLAASSAARAASRSLTMRRRTFQAAPSSSTKAVSTPHSAAVFSAAMRACEVSVSSVSCHSVPGSIAFCSSIDGPRRMRTSASPLFIARTRVNSRGASGARLYCRLRFSRSRCAALSSRRARNFHDGSEARITTPFSSDSSICMSALCQRCSSGSSPTLTTATPPGRWPLPLPNGADR